MEMPDRSTRFCYPLLANLCVDTIERFKVTGCKSNGCTACVASKGELHRFHATFARKSTPEMRKMYEDLLSSRTFFTADGGLANKAALRRAETQLGRTRLIANAFWSFRFFCVYSYSMPDALHLADLGIFPHILFAIIADWRCRVFAHLDDEAKRLEVAMDRLAARLAGVKFLDNQGVGSEYVCNVGHKIAEAQDDAESTLILKAWEFRRLAMVCGTSCKVLCGTL